jgi:hypothetical protein
MVYDVGADPCGRAVQGVGLRLLACWDCGFESRRGLGCLYLMFVVCCQVEVSAKDRQFIQRNPTAWVSLCDLEASAMWRVRPEFGCCATRKNILTGLGDVMHIGDRWHATKRVKPK